MVNNTITETRMLQLEAIALKIINEIVRSILAQNPEEK